MLMRMKNPMRNLSREAKIGLGVAGGVVALTAVIATIAWAVKSEPEVKALEIGPGCTSFTILSMEKLRDDLRARLRSAAGKGPIDPLQLTSKYLRFAASRCPTYPGNTDTPGQVKLFATVYDELLSIMVDEDFISEADREVWTGMMITWAAGQGVAAKDL